MGGPWRAGRARGSRLAPLTLPISSGRENATLETAESWGEWGLQARQREWVGGGKQEPPGLRAGGLREDSRGKQPGLSPPVREALGAGVSRRLGRAPPSTLTRGACLGRAASWAVLLPLPRGT